MSSLPLREAAKWPWPSRQSRRSDRQHPLPAPSLAPPRPASAPAPSVKPVCTPMMTSCYLFARFYRLRSMSGGSAGSGGMSCPSSTAGRSRSPPPTDTRVLAKSSGGQMNPEGKTTSCMISLRCCSDQMSTQRSGRGAPVLWSRRLRLRWPGAASCAAASATASASLSPSRRQLPGVWRQPRSRRNRQA